MGVGDAIETYIRDSLHRQALPLTVVLLKSDGLVRDATNAPALTEAPALDAQTVVGCLCRRDVASPDHYVCIPHDDAIFRSGLVSVLSPFPWVAWEDRKSVAFWRGGASGFDRPSLRVRVAQCLADHPNADVRITPWGGWENGQEISPALFAPRCDPSVYFGFKYLLIVDGNCIASNHQWTFGTGAVPLMITHPENVYWFQRFLIPRVNYIPIRYDLSDLRETLDWLVSHDADAKRIAENAVALAETIFSPSFQQSYIDEALAEASVRLSSPP
jgi:hypothetical protein